MLSGEIHFKVQISTLRDGILWVGYLEITENQDTTGEFSACRSGYCHNKGKSNEKKSLDKKKTVRSPVFTDVSQKNSNTISKW